MAAPQMWLTNCLIGDMGHPRTVHDNPRYLPKLALKPDKVLFNFKEHMCAVRSEIMHAEPASVVYLSVLDIHADTVEAMSEVAAMLYKEYIVITGAEHLVVVGDAPSSSW